MSAPFAASLLLDWRNPPDALGCCAPSCHFPVPRTFGFLTPFSRVPPSCMTVGTWQSPKLLTVGSGPPVALSSLLMEAFPPRIITLFFRLSPPPFLSFLMRGLVEPFIAVLAATCLVFFQLWISGTSSWGDPHEFPFRLQMNLSLQGVVRAPLPALNRTLLRPVFSSSLLPTVVFL